MTIIPIWQKAGMNRLADCYDNGIRRRLRVRLPEPLFLMALPAAGNEAGCVQFKINVRLCKSAETGNRRSKMTIICI